jgi:hypothetical protein
MAFEPAAAWAFRDRYPVGYDFVAGSSLDTCRIALDAVNHDAPVEWVELVFDSAVSVVSDAEVTNTTGNTYRIATKRKIDLFGDGKEDTYWYLDLDISGESDGSLATITEVNVRSGGTTYDMIGDGRLTTREVYVSRSPTVRYINPAASGANDGTSWTDAWETMADAVSGLNGIRTQQVVIRCRGTISSAGSTTVWNVNHFNGGEPYKVFVDDDDTTHWQLTRNAGNSVKNLIALVGGTVELTATGSNANIRYSNDHISMEGVSFIFQNKANTSGTNHIITSAGAGAEGHVSIINCSQENGHSGIRFLVPGGDVQPDCIIHNFRLNNSGTAMGGSARHALIQHCQTTNCAGDDYDADTHFNNYSWNSVEVLTGFNWDASESQITKTGGFEDVQAQDLVGQIAVEVNSGNGAATGMYAVTAITNDSVTIDGTLNASDISDSSVNITVYAPTLRDSIIRNTFSYGNGNTTGPNSYGWGALAAGNNVAIYNERVYNDLNNQPLVTLENQQKNVQWVRSTLLNSDNDAQDAQRGLILSAGRGGEFGSEDFLFRHNIIPRIADGGSVISASANMVLGANIVLRQEDGVVQDGTVRASADTLATLGLADLSADPPNLAATSTTTAILTEDNADFDDVYFDAYGEEMPQDGDGAVGAGQPAAAPTEPTPRAPMRMSDLLTPTVSLEADPATVVATATATFYVDFEAGSDGSGTSGSPWNTLAGKEATIDAVVGSVAVVMAGIADGQQIAGLAFSNGSGTTLSFISWHLLDGAKTRAHWTPAIKMDRIDTPSMSGSVIDYDLTDIETALAARGWSGTFDVQAVLSGYTPFTGQTSIPASGLRTLAQDLVTDGAYYESFRRVTGSAKVVWEEVGSAAAVSVADTWHFDGTTDVVRARQATVPDDGYIVYLDDAGNQVVTISGWEEPRFLGVRFFLLGDRGDRRFVQATTKRMLLQDIECEGTGADDTFALLNSAGDANSGLTMRRCQFSGMGKDGNPIVVSTNTTPDYKSWHSIDTISHVGWRYEYTDSVPTGGLQGTDAGILNDQATYFGAPHAGDLEEIRIERGFGFAYNSKTARLIQSQPNDSPTDYTDISDYKSVLIGLRAEGLSGIDQANVYRRTLVVACNLEGAGNAANSHLFGRNGNLGEAVGFVACILRGSVSMRSAIALWNTTNAFISRCLFHCDQNGISAKQGANAWTGEVTLDNNLYLFINDNKSWWGVAQGGGEVTASVADSIKDIDGGLEIAEAFENCDFYENTLDHTDQTSADVDATFPNNSNVYDTSMTVPANGAATSANLSTRGIPEIDGVLTVIEGDDVSINGQFHSGTFGPFQYGGFGVSAGGILSRSRLWRSRLQRI